MKKTLGVLIVGMAVSFIAACSVNTESESSATLSYNGHCDSIVFTDPTDTVYQKYIVELINSKEFPLVGDNSYFQESATSDDAYIENAIFLCNDKALKTYESMLKTLSPANMRFMLNKNYGDKVDLSQLDDFTIYYSLLGFFNSKVLLVGRKSIEYYKVETGQ